MMVGYFGTKGTDLNIERNYNQFDQRNRAPTPRFPPVAR